MTEKGHIKLIDFNIAKNNFSKSQLTYTLIGNVEYFAPEQISKNGYGYSVDFWQYTVLLYELFYGYTAFVGKTNLETYSNILHGSYNFSLHNFIGHKISRPFKLFITALFQIHVTARLGNGVVHIPKISMKNSNNRSVGNVNVCNGTIYYIMNHDFFKYHNIDWDDLTSNAAPIIPTVDDKWTLTDSAKKKRTSSVARYEKMLRRGQLHDVYEDVVEIAFKDFDWECMNNE